MTVDRHRCFPPVKSNGELEASVFGGYVNLTRKLLASTAANCRVELTFQKYLAQFGA
jgi:hypothetical protein